MKIFMDMEFTGLRKDTTAVSLGIVYESGHEFYAEFTDYDENQLNDWLHVNVIEKLTLNHMEVNSTGFSDDMKRKAVKGTKEYIAEELGYWHQYLSCSDEVIHVWSDCLAYDWVLFCDMFGGAFKVPDNISYIPFDICTMFELCRIDPDIGREQFAEMTERGDKHNSLFDARVIKKCYEKLVTLTEVKTIAPIVIPIAGKAESGKDATANMMKEILEEKGKKVCIVHFADYIKYMAEKYLGWNGVKDEPGRQLLMEEGTNFVRGKEPDFWILIAYNFIKMYKERFDYFLIPDTRFPSECNWLKNDGDFTVKTVKVVRPNHENALTEDQRNHSTETSLDDYLFDIVISSCSGLDNLREQVEAIFLKSETALL